MIASLGGTVQLLGVDHVVVDVHGVGYLVQASSRALARMEPGAAVFLLVETQVREDSITLFGFPNEGERDWFRLLTTVQAVGGRLALAILGTLDADAIASAITHDDKAVLTRAPGVGPRIAARIITELKGKVPAVAPRLAGGAGADGADGAAAPTDASADAVSALLNLGFRPADAQRAVADAITELGAAADAPLVIRHALKRLGR